MITSAGNEKMKTLRKLLRDRQERTARGLFVIEGRKMVSEAPEGSLREIYLSGSFAEALPEPIPSQGGAGEKAAFFRDGVPAEVVEDGLFARICDTKTPQGILAVAKMPAWDLEAVFSRPAAPLVLVAENLQDPGNAGTILRTAEAAGADAVIFTGNSVDIYNPKCVRSTMGSVFRMPHFHFPDTAKALELLRKHGVTSYAAALDSDGGYAAQDYRGGCAFLVGNEANGLLPETVRGSDRRILIPMSGKIESLNAAVSAAVLLYEAKRQRE